ncbi:hypothetical protein Pan44_21920 [Caulifigura coniformis]|uniref:UPF0235 protein Pan44_21920 n=1 Tax=Caulifigura coniformis TaxID=2527983 RepID=A0A517SDH1_9PLAN|nr:DUF167 domain-containing protein [Caulifigura coniformis]QDT54165.1 hypothetical protein Pan44_21920 [Caulifigura coniformis]
MSVPAISLVADGGDVLLPVRAQPGAKRVGVVGEHGGRLKVAVTAVAEKGKANEALVESVAEAFGLKRSQVTLVSGQTSNQKTFRLSRVSIEVVQSRLAELFEGLAR